MGGYRTVNDELRKAIEHLEYAAQIADSKGERQYGDQIDRLIQDVKAAMHVRRT